MHAFRDRRAARSTTVVTRVARTTSAARSTRYARTTSEASCTRVARIFLRSKKINFFFAKQRKNCEKHFREAKMFFVFFAPSAQKKFFNGKTRIFGKIRVFTLKNANFRAFFAFFEEKRKKSAEIVCRMQTYSPLPIP